MSSYDFNKREDYDYSFSHDYLGGVGLGRSQVDSEREKAERLGKYDLTPVSPPVSHLDKDEIIKIATLIHSSTDRESLKRKIFSVKDKRTEFLWNTNHKLHPYFEWALHCIDREVKDWEHIHPPSMSSSSTSPTGSSCITACNIGDTVEIQKIKSRTELNHKRGRIVGESEDHNRWLIEFSDIKQTISIGKANCIVVTGSPVNTTPSEGAAIPNGMKIIIHSLSSDSGKLLNGLYGTIVEFNLESQRYSVRVDGEPQIKSLKESNLKIPVPPDWTEEYDSASGKHFYVHQRTGEITWKHPLFHHSKRKQIEDPEDEDDTEDVSGEFNRREFLRLEEKRLKLDRRKGKMGIEDVTNRLNALRDRKLLANQGMLFSGTPQMLVSLIEAERREDGEIEKLLIAALYVLVEDYKQLKFNKSQLAALLDKIEDIFEDDCLFSPQVIEWIIGGLKLAIPISYSV